MEQYGSPRAYYEGNYCETCPNCSALWPTALNLILRDPWQDSFFPTWDFSPTNVRWMIILPPEKMSNRHGMSLVLYSYQGWQCENWFGYRLHFCFFALGQVRSKQESRRLHEFNWIPWTLRSSTRGHAITCWPSILCATNRPIHHLYLRNRVNFGWTQLYWSVQRHRTNILSIKMFVGFQGLQVNRRRREMTPTGSLMVGSSSKYWGCGLLIAHSWWSNFVRPLTNVYEIKSQLIILWNVLKDLISIKLSCLTFTRLTCPQHAVVIL